MKQLPAVLGLAALVTGCAVLPRDVTFIRGNVRCEGLQDDFLSATRYSSVWVGRPDAPYKGSPRVTFRFPDGTQVQSDRIEVGSLKALADRSAPHRSASRLQEQGWPAGTEELSVAGYRFLVHADMVVCFGIDHLATSGRLLPELGDAEGKVFLRPPFRQRDLVALFGPPDNVRKRIAGGPL